MARVAPLGLATLLVAACMLRTSRGAEAADFAQAGGPAASASVAEPGGREPAVQDPSVRDPSAQDPPAIALHVTDLGGAPIRELRLWLYRAGEGDEVPSQRLALRSENGRFTVPVDVAGDWHLWPEVDGERLLGVDRTPWLGPITVPSAAPLALILLKPGQVSGRVVDGEGRPVVDAEIEVTLVTPTDDDPDFTTTGYSSGEDGAFVIECAPATVGDERLVLSAQRAGGGRRARCELTLNPGSHVDSVVLMFAGTRSVAGVVLDFAGEPFPSVTVDLFPLDSTREFPLSCETDEDGRFEFRAVPAERFRLEVDYAWAAFALRDDDSAGGFESLALLHVDCRRTAQRRISVRPVPLTGHLVAGVLTDSKGPADSRRLIFLREGSDLQPGDRFALSGADGAFEVQLPDGVYSVFARRHELDDAVDLGLVQVPTQGERLALRIPGGAISGRVVRPDGAPADSVALTAFCSDRFSPGGFLLTHGCTTQTDAEGRFALDELEAGRWTILSTRLGWEDEVVGASEPIELGPDERREGVRLACVPTVPLTVVMTHASTELRANLFVRRADGRQVIPFLLGQPYDPETTLRLPAGRVQVLALQADRASSWSPEVDLRLAAPTSLELRLRPAATVHVTCARPLTERPATIRLYDAGGEVSAIQSRTHVATKTQARDAHRRRFGPLPPGAYRVVAEAADGRRIERSFALAAGDALELTLEL